MTYCTDIESIKAARQPHRCSWCGERIDAGTSYFRWRCYDGGEANTVWMHPECKGACDEDYRDGETEFYFHANPRGCRCGFSAGCDRCEAMRTTTGSAT